jgi:uncharacterized protein (TIGR02186 family)
MIRHLFLMPIICAALTLPGAAPAANPVLVPEVSQNKIDIVYSFTGVNLLLYGAVLYPGGRVPTDDADIVVVIRGPSESIVVREKQKLAGLIWVNADRAQFRSAPSFYAMASSKPVTQILDKRTAAIFELGLGNLYLSPASGAAQDIQARFEKGLVDLRQRFDLYSEAQNRVQIKAGVLYTARMFIPARVGVGAYTAETFLVKDGRVLAVATSEINIKKSGFERFVAESAKQWPFLYGITAVLMSLVLGWGADRVFRRL